MIEQDAQIETEDDTDEALEAAFAEREKRRGGEPPAEAPESPQAESEPAPSAEGQGEPEADPEPFEGYSALPESVRAKWDEINAKAAEAERLAAEHAKLKGDFSALQGRLAPTQRELERLKHSQQAPKAQAPQADIVKWDDWVGGLNAEEKAWAKEFPEEARMAFRAAQSVGSAFARQAEERVNATVTELRKQAEIDRLSAKHGDWTEYRQGPNGPETQKAQDYWQWVAKQSPDIQQLADGQTAQEVSVALDVYKWEKQNPEYEQVISHPAFGPWLESQPSVFKAVVRGANTNDRLILWERFVADFDRQSQPKDTARADKVAERRDKQARNISPSVRSNVAPASTAAASGADAEIEAAFFARQQHLSKRR